MNNKRILENAPEGATHRTSCCYLKREGKGSCTWFLFYQKEWVSLNGDCDISDFENYRSLADIQRIVELEEENTKLHMKIKESDVWLDSFIECESDKEFYNEHSGGFEPNNIDFNEALMALKTLRRR